jgi:hypothetical protein
LSTQTYMTLVYSRKMLASSTSKIRWTWPSRLGESQKLNQIKYAHDSCGTQTWERLWKKINWLWVWDGCLAPRQTGRLTVGRNITLTWLYTISLIFIPKQIHLTWEQRKLHRHQLHISYIINNAGWDEQDMYSWRALLEVGWYTNVNEMISIRTGHHVKSYPIWEHPR